jgi:hypothetical protein
LDARTERDPVRRQFAASMAGDHREDQTSFFITGRLAC